MTVPTLTRPPRGSGFLLMLMVFLVVLGLASTTASIITARTTNNASQGDIERNNALTRQVGQLVKSLDEQQAASSEAAARYRKVISSDHAAQCRAILAIATAAGIHITEPCRTGE